MVVSWLSSLSKFLKREKCSPCSLSGLVLVSLGASERNSRRLMPTVHSLAFCVIKSCFWVPELKEKIQCFLKMSRDALGWRFQLATNNCWASQGLVTFCRVSGGPSTSSLVLTFQSGRAPASETERGVSQEHLQAEGSVGNITSWELQYMSICVGDPSQASSEKSDTLGE